MTWLLVLMACAPGGAELTNPNAGDGGGNPGPVVTQPGTTGTNPGTATGTGTGTATGGYTTPPGPVPIVAEWAADGFDPMFGDEVEWTVTTDPGVSVTVRLVHSSEVVVEVTGVADASGELTGAWDATSESGWVIGRVELEAEVDGSGESASDELGVVRVGLVEAYADDDDGLTSTRVPLFYPGDSALQDAAYPLVRLEAIDADEGPIDFPAVDEETVLGRAMTDTQPTAYTFDSRPILSVVPAADFQSTVGETGLRWVDVAVSLQGWTVLEGVPMRAGQPVTLMRDEPLGDSVGVTEEDLELVFSVGESEVGRQVLPFRAYRVLAPATFGWPEDKYNPWVAGVDPLLRAIDGTPAEHDAVASAVADWVYHELGLVYDTDRGASFYSEYGGGWDAAWDEPHFYFSDFLTRENGTVVNCTDSGNILTTYSNMVGAELHHLIILENFDLNEIKAIGIDDYTSCPFGPRGCGFSYHAVTTPDAGDTIWDATLALDGDVDPGSAPYDELLVHAIDGEEYLDRLVRAGGAAYYYESQGTIQ